jgi:MFS family permease
MPDDRRDDDSKMRHSAAARLRRSLRDIATREADTGAPPQEVVRHGGTFESFRHRAFSLFWSGALISNVGTWMQNVILSLVVYGFRRSEADLGIVSFAQGIPVLFLAIWAGSLADRLDRKMLIVSTQFVLMFQAAALGWLYMTGHLSPTTPATSLLWVIALSVVAGTMSALSFPAWQAVIPDLVPRKDLLNAVALNSAQFQSARMLGPIVASVLVIAGLRPDGIFYLNAASFLFVIGAIWLVTIRPMERHAGEQSETPWRRVTAGLRYARENRTVGIILLSTAVLTIFGMGYVVLIPSVADKVLGYHVLADRDRIASYIYAANGLGAVVSSLIVAGLPQNVRRENLMRYSLMAMSLLLIAFSLSRNLAVILVVSGMAGAAVLTTSTLANTSIQASVPNHLRGRVMSLFVVAFMGFLPISGLLIGIVAQRVGTMTAIGGSSLVLLAWAITLFARPQLLGIGPAGAANPGEPGL